MYLKDAGNYVISSVLFSIFFVNSCNAIKCFECNSANNSACIDLRFKRIIPVVTCGKSLPNLINKEFFCRKITHTILHMDKTPEVRVTRGCGWVRSKRECYGNDNKDRLETACQCFSDLCNGSSLLQQNLPAISFCLLIYLYRFLS